MEPFPHLYFNPDGAPMQSSTGGIAPGVDVKADGGYVIMPPSVLLPSKLGPGGTYRFEKGGLDQRAALPPFPDPLRARLNAKKKVLRSAARGPAGPEPAASFFGLSADAGKDGELVEKPE